MKLMNTLTRRFNFLTLPKLHTNLFSIIGLILMSMGLFLTPLSGFASHDCEAQQATYDAAKDAADAAYLDYLAACAEAADLAQQDDVGFFEAAAAALKVASTAKKWLAAKKITKAAKKTLDDCLATCHCGCGLGKECGKDGSCPGPNPPNDDDGIGFQSGGCDSGGSCN